MAYTYKGYYSALKRKKILSHATLWVDFEGIMLSEISHAKNTVWFHLYEVLRVAKFTGTDSRMVVA